MSSPSFVEKVRDEAPDDAAAARTFSEKTSIDSQPGTQETHGTTGWMKSLSNLASDALSARSDWVTKPLSATGSHEQKEGRRRQ